MPPRLHQLCGRFAVYQGTAASGCAALTRTQPASRRNTRGGAGGGGTGGVTGVSGRQRPGFGAGAAAGCALHAHVLDEHAGGGQAVLVP